MVELLHNVGQWLARMWDTETFGYILLRIIAILLAGKVAVWLLHKTINRVVLDDAPRRTVNQARRMTTIGKLLKNVSAYTIYFIMFMLLLSEVGINLGPLLAGAGVVGLAIGFGAQSLVKDVITGFFIIMEDQFAVGDVIQTGKFKGTVEVIGLRTTRIVSWTGEVHILPNSMIQDVTNFSVHNSLAVVDVPLPAATNVELALVMMKETVGGLHHEHLTKEPEVLGIQTLTASEMTIRIIAECAPNSQSEIARFLHKRIKEAMQARDAERSGARAQEEG